MESAAYNQRVYAAFVDHGRELAVPDFCHQFGGSLPQIVRVRAGPGQGTRTNDKVGVGQSNELVPDSVTTRQCTARHSQSKIPVYRKKSIPSPAFGFVLYVGFLKFLNLHELLVYTLKL